MNQAQLTGFATRYAAAWSGQVPTELALFYAEDGALMVNAGSPSSGRAAIVAKVSKFMEAFPDMLVEMDSVVSNGEHATFHWTWTGANSGPGGTCRPVRVSGYEQWTLGPQGLISQSMGHCDEAEYARQMSTGD